MSSIVAVFKSLVRFTEVVKDLPLWLLIAFTAASAILLFVPQINSQLPNDFRPWLLVSLIIFSILAITRAFTEWHASTIARKTFYLTPIAQHCFWSVNKQTDGSLVTQISADFSAKNKSDQPVGLIHARIIKPKIRGDTLQDVITVREQHGNMYGTAYVSDFRIAPRTSLPARVMIIILGKPKKDHGEDLNVVLGISDEDGYEQRVRVTCKGLLKSNPRKLPRPIETLYSISDPIEKDVASVLQSEISRYENNGREVGGLGSISIFIKPGREIKQLGTEWLSKSVTSNQEIDTSSEWTEIKSDNLEALMSLYSRLTKDDERGRFKDALLGRLQEKKGYARVAYFVVLALWKIGLLEDALETAKHGLSEESQKDYGVSNILMLLNGLLRYRHTDFTPDMLDTIEHFLQGIQEPVFRIPQKISAIRVQRLSP